MTGKNEPKYIENVALLKEKEIRRIILRGNYKESGHL
jgi:hypothetical protein